AIEQREGGVVVNEVAGVEVLALANHPVDAADDLIVGVVGEIAEDVLPARVGGNREEAGGEFEAGDIESGTRNSIIGVRSSTRFLGGPCAGQAAAVGLSSVQDAEVSL